jgi:hypothetical protein
MMDTKTQVQPIVRDAHGVVRFKENSIVRFLLNSGPVDLNWLAAIRTRFTQEDWQQFYQLIGFSVSGYGDLPGVSPESIAQADAVAKALRK